MTTALNHYATRGNYFVSQLATELDMPQNNANALKILRAVLHTIRKYLTPSASMHLVDHLPVAVKGIYVDGWNFEYPQKSDFDYEAFINDVLKTSKMSQFKPFCHKSDVEGCVQAVFKTLKQNLPDGEYNDMMSYMPMSLRLYLNEDYILDGQSYFY